MAEKIFFSTKYFLKTTVIQNFYLLIFPPHGMALNTNKSIPHITKQSEAITYKPSKRDNSKNNLFQRITNQHQRHKLCKANN